MIAVLAVMLGGCNKYDDSELRNMIKDLEKRISSVEELNTYKDLLSKLDKGKTVIGVAESNGEYTLTFDDNSSIKFNQKGEPGESITGPAGVSPQIKNEDGKWWISTDEGKTWTEAGSSVGTPGADAVTPQFRIDEETTAWEVSYDNGKTWTKVGSAMDRSLIAGIDKDDENEIVTITLADGSKIAMPYTDANVVDMGLSVKWAKCNLDATAPEERGNAYAWGDTKILPNSDYSYKWGDVRNKKLTKYISNSEYGTVDNKVELDPEDDIVRITLGGKYRMPTKEEAQILINNCTITEETVNGVNGWLFTSNINGNTLFFPSVGYAVERWYNGSSYYWTSTKHATSDDVAFSLLVFKASNGTIRAMLSSDSVGRRYVGHCIRPVKD